MTCPYGYYFNENNNATMFTQTCVQCATGSNCARCMVSSNSSSNLTMCTSCFPGSYLNGTSCASCNTGCAFCATLGQCLICSPGYIATQSGSIAGNLEGGILNCTPCTSPCASCEGSSLTCTSCVSGFSMKGGNCLSNFNYAVSVTFSVSLAQFQTNYLGFLNQMAASAGVAVNNIIINSIVAGSVIVDMSVTSFASPGSSDAINNQNNMNNLLNSGNINNMQVSTTSLSTVGGSNTVDSGLSQTTIIILAVVIPVGVLRTYLSI
jgi:hypothetical protein